MEVNFSAIRSWLERVDREFSALSFMLSPS